MRRLALLASAAALALAFASPASAQQDDRRISDLQRQVRELRAIVFQGRDTGQPVEVKPVGPDPQVVALQTKVDDLEQSLRQATGANEVLTHDIDEARRGLENERAQGAAGRQALSDRIAKLEAQIAAQAAAAAAPPPQPAYEPPPADTAVPTPRLRPRSADTGPPPGAAAASPADAYADGAARLAAADYPGAQAAFESYLAAEPAGARASEARYSIGQSLYARENYGPAARSYALSLKGWPKSKWAPDATVRLAQSLNQAGRNPDACAALGEFDRRYAATAATAVKARAALTRRSAACGAG